MVDRTEIAMRDMYKNLSHYEWWIRDYMYGCEDTKTVKARNIGHVIWDMAPIWTGYMSANLLLRCLENGKVYRGCYEHFRSRLRSGRDILDFFAYRRGGAPTFEEFREHLNFHRQVHRTTSEENNRLSKFQQQGMHWVEAYAAAGIELVKIDMGERKSLSHKYLAERYDPFLKANLADVAAELG